MASKSGAPHTLTPSQVEELIRWCEQHGNESLDWRTILTLSDTSDLRCRYEDCINEYPVAGEGATVSCPVCRVYLGLPVAPPQG